MCGIFGFVLNKGSKITEKELVATLNELYKFSESRGKDSAGFCAYIPSLKTVWTIKGGVPASLMLKSEKFKKTISQVCKSIYTESKEETSRSVSIIAHTRLVTNGSAEKIENNQPVRSNGLTMVHNGIVANVDELWSSHLDLERKTEVDTEIIATMLAKYISNGTGVSEAVAKVYSEIKGSASTAWICEYVNSLVLGTNTGDIYYYHDDKKGVFVFASENYILSKSIIKINNADAKKVECLAVNNILAVSIDSLHVQTASMAESLNFGPKNNNGPIEYLDYSLSPMSEVGILNRNFDFDLLKYNESNMREMKRCSKCILPETFPYIKFDNSGVCNYCNNYKPNYMGKDNLNNKIDFIASLEKYRRAGGSHDVLVPFSGGRDSCYGLHLIKHEFGLNPITFTYDWGMVTDLARRNIARLCGELGVQNILVSADIKMKRENIKKNITAWLKEPDLGIVPLFMAGDKHFFKIVNDLKRQTGIKLDLWSANPLENTDFKSGFCGVSPDFNKERIDYLSLTRKMRLAFYYGIKFMKNPSYINSSMLDTAQAFLSYYLEPRKDFFFMFHHMEWREDLVNEVLLNQYDFELAPDSPSTWRIGDGTAPFYNYIYMTAKGFTEFDTFRSNQIREGHITREEALESVLVENRPRAESLKWYLDTVGLSFNETIKQVNKLDVLGLH